METENSIREDIVHIRNELDRTSCSHEEKALEDICNVFKQLIGNHYNNSYVLYIISSITVPLTLFLIILLFYYSAKLLNEQFLRQRLSKELHQSSIIIGEMRKREMSQASRRSARRRTIFAVVLKCVLATTVLFLFIGSRVLMEMITRGWLRELFTPLKISNYSVNKEELFDIRQELYYNIISLLSVNWFKDLQSLFLFSTIGSGMMVFGLRLLRSASEDVTSICTQCNASLHFLQGVDDKHTAQGQELMQKQLSDLLLMFSELMSSSVEGPMGEKERITMKTTNEEREVSEGVEVEKEDEKENEKEDEKEDKNENEKDDKKENEKE